MEAFSLGRARSYGVDADFLGAQLSGEDARYGVNRAFGRSIDNHLLRSPLSSSTNS
jgi:hypothetical protein